MHVKKLVASIVTVAAMAAAAPSAFAQTTAVAPADTGASAPSCRTICDVVAPAGQDPTAGMGLDPWYECTKMVRNAFINHGYDPKDHADEVEIFHATVELCGL